MSIDIDLKVVPGASRTKVAGMLGERLKLQISAPPENGKANKSIKTFLAKQLNLSKVDVEVIKGLTSPFKTVRINNFDGEKNAVLNKLKEKL